ncbi:Crp/Fnr family transcriptional regulator [Paenibacillus sp. 79R4]|uniref:Crp/Fnr family transcriptional regulator n=1 Tax=Paenibacillus sp. 79R4 TaxID=2212847 RepID=UPI0015B83B0C|nr:Crp/Fnr family transcriptional regulator [Paenibacillus sp. 79R4]NWL86140.1 Crp/Fnr family transcriptional regulator [Paenibacillus sp. 79R4]
MDNCSHTQNHANCIENVPIFSGLNDKEMLEIAHITTAQTFKKGEMLYLAGDMSGKLYVLHTGKVKVARFNPNGKEQVIRLIGPGEFMGELSLFSSVPLTDNAEALETSTLCIIEGSKLMERMGKYPTIAFKVMDVLSKRLEKAENLIEEISLTSVEQRIAGALLSSADASGNIVLGMKKGDFASQLGMSQETLSRKLAAFQEEGLIELSGPRKMKIVDIAELSSKRDTAMNDVSS